MGLDIFWFLPTSGDTRYLGKSDFGRPAANAYMRQIAETAARLQEYADLGVDSFMLSGYPHLEEAIHFAELVFPLLPGKQPVTLRDQVLTGGAFDVRTGQR